jgi:hypothetical protein
MTRLSLALALALAACGGKHPTTTTTPVTGAAAAPTTTFELGELVLFEGPDAMFKVHADGSTEIGYRHGELKVEPGKPASSDSLPIEWKPGPTIKADGTIEDKGKPMVGVAADGTITNLEDGKPMPLKVTADSISIAGATIGLAADGAIQLPAGVTVKPGHEGRVTGADTTGKRRVMLTMIGLLLSGPSRAETSAPTSAP